MVTCNIRQKQRKGPTQELFTTAVSFGKQNLSTTSALLCPRVLVSASCCWMCTSKTWSHATSDKSKEKVPHKNCLQQQSALYKYNFGIVVSEGHCFCIMLLNVHFQDMVTCNIRQKKRKGPTQELFTTAVSFGKQNLSTTSALLCPRVLVSASCCSMRTFKTWSHATSDKSKEKVPHKNCLQQQSALVSRI